MKKGKNTFLIYSKLNLHVLLSIYCKRNCESNRLDIELREEGVARIIYKMSASPQQQTNEWCRIFQL